VSVKSWRCYLSSVFMVAFSPCWAANCSLNVQGVNFGNYDVFNSQSLESTGNIDVSCNSQKTNYTLMLSAGVGSYNQRKMIYGSYALNYNLYTSSNLSAIWGDGSVGTSLVSGSGSFRSFVIYGRVFAQQNIYVGQYNDYITVTVSF